jgi:serine/threonine protein kinase
MLHQEIKQSINEQLPASIRQAALEHFEGCAACRQHLAQWLPTGAPGIAGSVDTHIDSAGSSAVANIGQSSASLDRTSVRGTHSLPTQKLSSSDLTGDERGLLCFPEISETTPWGRLGNYRLLEPLGEGGFGTVYKAQDETIGRLVAIKVLKDHHAISEPREVLLAEARRASKVQSEFVVQVISVNHHAGFDYLVLDYIDGEPLSKRMRAGVEASQAATWVAQIARGLDALHRGSVLHLDVKPSNVLIPVATNRALLTDIGLDRNEVPIDGETKIRSRGGTPAYMSPEQIREEIVDERTDIFSLGVMFFELLHGTRPFSGDRNQLVHTIQFDHPQLPIHRGRRPPADLCAIANKCLQKQPAARYQSAQQVAEDIWRWQHHQPILAQPASLLKRSQLWTRRNWWQLSLLSLALIAIVALYQWNVSLANAKYALERDLSSFREARTALRSLTIDMTGRLAAVPQAAKLRRDFLMTAKDYLESSLRKYGDVDSLQAETLDSHLMLAIIENGLGNAEVAAREFKSADGGFQSLMEQANLSERDLYFLTLYFNDRWRGSPDFTDPSLEDLENGLRFAERYYAASKTPEAIFYLASSRINLGTRLLHESKYEQGEKLLRQGIQEISLADENAGRRKLLQSQALDSLVTGHLRQSNLAAALEEMRKLDVLMPGLNESYADHIGIKELDVRYRINKFELASQDTSAVLVQLYQSAVELWLMRSRARSTVQLVSRTQQWLLDDSSKNESLMGDSLAAALQINRQLTDKFDLLFTGGEKVPTAWWEIGRNAYDIQVLYAPADDGQKSLWIERAFELTPAEDRKDAAWVHIARGYFLEGDIKTAQEKLSQIGRFIPLDAEGNFNLACVYSLGGRAASGAGQEKLAQDFADRATAVLSLTDMRKFIRSLDWDVLQEQYLPKDSDLHWLYQRNPQLFHFEDTK